MQRNIMIVGVGGQGTLLASRILGNLLVARGYDVKVGKTDDYEIDFVAYKGTDILYVQVCYLLASPETVDREFGNLERIKDNYPKYVVSGDIPDFSRNGIKHYNIIKFLLNE